MFDSRDDFIRFAKAGYDNPCCLSEVEFLKDLEQIKIIKRMMTKYINSDYCNVRLLVNNFIIFFNCFNHRHAISILKYKIDYIQHSYYNSVLYYLNYPLLDENLGYDVDLYEKIKREFR